VKETHFFPFCVLLPSLEIVLQNFSCKIIRRRAVEDGAVAPTTLLWHRHRCIGRRRYRTCAAQLLPLSSIALFVFQSHSWRRQQGACSRRAVACLQARGISSAGRTIASRRSASARGVLLILQASRGAGWRNQRAARPVFARLRLLGVFISMDWAAVARGCDMRAIAAAVWRRCAVRGRQGEKLV
jgi:hypothetical protein